MSAPRPRLLVVGTVHLDPQGEAELARLLDDVRPACITVEVSRWGLLFRARHGQALRARVDAHLQARGLAGPNDALTALLRQLEPPFEWTAALAHAQAHGLRAVPIDRSAISHAHLQELTEAFSPANLDLLLDDQEFSLSRAHIEQLILSRRYRGDDHLLPLHFGREEKQELAARGEAMVRVLCGHLSRVDPGPVVHVGGWCHLMRPSDGAMRTLATILDEQHVEWTSHLLGGRLPPGWGPPEESDPAGEGAWGDLRQEHGE